MKYLFLIFRFEDFLMKYSDLIFRKYPKSSREKSAAFIPIFHDFVPKVSPSSVRVLLPHLRPKLPWHVSLKCQKENQELDVIKAMNQSNLPNPASCRRIWISGGLSQF